MRRGREAGEVEGGGKAGGGSERPMGGREKKGLWEGRGDGDNVNLASTCEGSYGGGAGEGGAGRPGSEGRGTGGGGRRPCGKGRETSASGPSGAQVS